MNTKMNRLAKPPAACSSLRERFNQAGVVPASRVRKVFLQVTGLMRVLAELFITRFTPILAFLLEGEGIFSLPLQRES
jgi:hypothetical protein